jgi:uncharacterized LabA/DUF88 family protein
LGRQTALSGFVISRGKELKTVVYVDGYNLYYGLLRGTSYKWLDLYSLFQNQVLDNSAQVLEVRYYTAPVLKEFSDDPDSPQRQRIYLQALRKCPPNKVKIIEGKILKSHPTLRLYEPIPEAPDRTQVKVLHFQEKQTDVNIAVDLVVGAGMNTFEQAVLCSNDSDLKAALAAVKQYHPHIRLGLVVPISKPDERYISKDLAQQVHWKKILSPIHLQHAQLPQQIPKTSICKPRQWDTN